MVGRSPADSTPFRSSTDGNQTNEGQHDDQQKSRRLGRRSEDADEAERRITAAGRRGMPRQMSDAIPTDRQGPTMDQLIVLAENGPDAHYGRILGWALETTAPVVNEGDERDVLYHPTGSGTYGTCTFRKAGLTLVPADVLPHFRPENRGEEFPPDVPYVPLEG